MLVRVRTALCYTAEDELEGRAFYSLSRRAPVEIDSELQYTHAIDVVPERERVAGAVRVLTVWEMAMALLPDEKVLLKKI